jgi:hypothetical protein
VDPGPIPGPLDQVLLGAEARSASESVEGGPPPA